MKKQSVTPASLTSPATNSHLKGLQQYFTPEPWAQALAAALPQYRRTILDPFAGNGSFVRGLANDTTRDALGLDLDPTATLGGTKAWESTAAPDCRRDMAHGDLLDLLPLLDATGSRFDLVALNPPFSLTWPQDLLPKSIQDGRHTLNSTHATLRLAHTLLTPRGEAILIANQSSIEKLHASHPQDFSHCWLWLDLPAFFPGVDPATRIAVLYLTGEPSAKLTPRILPFPATPPSVLAAALDAARQRHFHGLWLEEPWHANRDSPRAFRNCCDEMERRRNPSAALCNVVLDDAGSLRTWVSAFQERSFAVPKHLADFLRKINRQHPVELTIQPASRAALTEAIDSGVWSIDPPARAAIAAALTAFATDRAPLAPLSQVQRLGWIDDTETLLCTSDFHEFKAGHSYQLSSQTVDWSKEELRPRYHSGKRSKEAVQVKGTDLQITLHSGTSARHFTFNPANLASARGAHASSGHPAASCGRSSSSFHTLADLAAHFHIPEVPDITAIHPQKYAENLALIDQLEAITP